MASVNQSLEQAFVCPKCHSKGATLEQLSMSGTGLSRLFEIQLHRYGFLSCNNCGYTEVYNLKVLQGRDDLGSLLDILFSN